MQRFEAHGGVPGVLHRLTAAAAGARVARNSVFARAGRHVDRRGGGEPQPLRQRPAVVVLKSGAPAANLAHTDDIRSAVGDFCEASGPSAASKWPAGAIGVGAIGTRITWPGTVASRALRRVAEPVLAIV